MSDDEFLQLCATGSIHEVEEAIRNGANVNAKDNSGMTALIRATMRSHTKTAEVLLKYGAAVNSEDNNGRTALMLAAENGHTKTANLLRRYRARSI